MSPTEEFKKDLAGICKFKKIQYTQICAQGTEHKKGSIGQPRKARASKITYVP